MLDDFSVLEVLHFGPDIAGATSGLLVKELDDLVEPALVAQAQPVFDIGSGCHVLEVYARGADRLGGSRIPALCNIAATLCVPSPNAA